MAFQGTLKDFGIPDVFQFIAQQKKNGILHLQHDKQHIEVYFESGAVIGCYEKGADIQEEVGQRLCDAALIDVNQWKKIKQEAQQTLKPCVDVLSKQANINSEQLDRVLRLIHLERLLSLFNWQDGSYSFSADDDISNLSWSLPQAFSCDFLVMEGCRILDEWGAVWKQLGAWEKRFQINPQRNDQLEQALGHSSEEEIEGLDDMFGDVDTTAKKTKQEVEVLSEHERTVLQWIPLHLSVTQLVGRTLLGQFETCKALVQLIEKQWIVPLEDVAQIQTLDAATLNSVESSRFGWLSHVCIWLVLAFSGFVALTTWSAGVSQFKQGWDTYYRGYQAISIQQQIDYAYQIHWLWAGFTPLNLDSLEKRRLLPKGAKFESLLLNGL